MHDDEVWRAIQRVGAQFVATAAENGAAAGQYDAINHLIAAAEFLRRTIGLERTKAIMVETIIAISEAPSD